ncbi:MAG TPA: hypothetical protein VIY73_11945, partial [Polyangiaceae bacterium]
MRAGRVVAGFGKTIGLVVVFVLAVVAGVLVHLDTPAVRRAVIGRTNAILASTFKGHVRVERLGGLGLGGLKGIDASVADPTGRPVLSVRGASVSVLAYAAASSAILDSKGPITIVSPNVSFDSIDVSLDQDAQGNLALADAFQPAKPSAPSAPNPNARGVRVIVPRIALGHVHVHQAAKDPASAPLDADLDRFRGSVRYDAKELDAAVSAATITARRIVGTADVVGSLEGHLKLPSAPGALPDAD